MVSGPLQSPACMRSPDAAQRVHSARGIDGAWSTAGSVNLHTVQTLGERRSVRHLHRLGGSVIGKSGLRLHEMQCEGADVGSRSPE